MTGRIRAGRWMPAMLAAAVLGALVVAPASAAPTGSFAWGADSAWQDGTGFDFQQGLETPTQKGLGAVVDVKEYAVGPNFALALLEDGSVMAWGLDNHGQTAGGQVNAPEKCPVITEEPEHPKTKDTYGCSKYPRRIKPLTGVVQVAAGDATGYALLSNGTVEAWGSDQFDQLGRPNVIAYYTPQVVPGLSEVKAIAAAGTHAFALLRSGQVMAWGNDGERALGIEESKLEQCPGGGNEGCVTKPTLISGLGGVTSIAANYAFTLALTETGTVTAWGRNDYGELGDGTATEKVTPVTVPGLEGVTQLAAGYAFGMALLAGDTVEAWGLNADGELALGTNTGPDCKGYCYASPVAVEALAGAKRLALGEFSDGYALTAGGEVLSWGLGREWSMGHPCPEACRTPHAVPGASGVTQLAAGKYNAFVYSPTDRPAATQITPEHAWAAGGRVVTISGLNLGGATSVFFARGGPTRLSEEQTLSEQHAAASFTVNSSTSITAVTPPLPATGAWYVFVSTPEGTSEFDPGAVFTPKAGGVSVLGISPSSGPTAGGTAVTVTGVGYSTTAGATTFDFGSVPATGVVCESSTSCTMVAPAASKAGPQKVKAKVGARTSEVNPDAVFTYE